MARDGKMNASGRGRGGGKGKGKGKGRGKGTVVDLEAQEFQRTVEGALKVAFEARGAGFRDAFRDELKFNCDCYPEDLDIEERNGRWTIKDVERGLTAYVGLRLEVDDDDNGEKGEQLQQHLRTAKDLLFAKDAFDRVAIIGLRSELESCKKNNYENILQRFARDGLAKGPVQARAARRDIGTLPPCKHCHVPMDLDQLGGRHHCKVIATCCCPRCKNSFTTQNGRYDGKRVLDHFCMRCKIPTKVMKWVLKTEEALDRLVERRERGAGGGRGGGRGGVVSVGGRGGVVSVDEFFGGAARAGGDAVAPPGACDAGSCDAVGVEHDDGEALMYVELVEAQPVREEDTGPRRKTAPHRADLCEGCIRYGDCRGHFADPLFMQLALQIFAIEAAKGQQHAGEPHKVQTDGRTTSIPELDVRVHLQPHVFVERSRRRWS